jgi:hypothetical protein
VTAFIARDTSCSDISPISPLAAVAMNGRRQRTGSSRHRGSRRSRHSFIANMSPASAAASVALLREPGRRPLGLADRPGSNGRPYPRPRPGAGRGQISSLIEEHSPLRVFFLLSPYTQYCDASIAIDRPRHGRSRPEPDRHIRRRCGSACSAHRSISASVRMLNGSADDRRPRDEIGHAERGALHLHFVVEFGCAMTVVGQPAIRDRRVMWAREVQKQQSLVAVRTAIPTKAGTLECRPRRRNQH